MATTIPPPRAREPAPAFPTLAPSRLFLHWFETRAANYLKNLKETAKASHAAAEEGLATIPQGRDAAKLVPIAVSQERACVLVEHELTTWRKFWRKARLGREGAWLPQCLQVEASTTAQRTHPHAPTPIPASGTTHNAKGGLPLPQGYAIFKDNRYKSQ